jgi:hypothetical protein
MHAATNTAPTADGRVVPWNKGKLIGQKPPLKLKEIWAIRIRLQLDHRARELALFNLAIDSKLRGCDLVGLHVRDVFQGSHVAPRAIVMQKKTQRPVQFEITEQTRDAVGAWIAAARLKPEQFLFPRRMSASPHLSTRQYSRIVHTWAGSIGLGHGRRTRRPHIDCGHSALAGEWRSSTLSGLSGLREADVRDVRSAAISGPSICCSLNLAFFTASSRLYANPDFEVIIGWDGEGQVITHSALSHA